MIRLIKKRCQRLMLLSGLLVLLTGCETITQSMVEVAEALPDVNFAPDTEVPLEPNWVQATGYAPISLQPGETQQQKMLMAMRASKLRAYQELAGVVHGQYLYGTTTVQDMVVKNDQFKTAVAGIVRGARVVKTYPVQDDTYATILEVDLNQVQRAWVVKN
ncbi:LPP20 family lipoprotein [Neptuniibacter sp. CAU 1671]|uniref:LPP20 family lipoprotein n=1 Tax=Neptuniibacter sp. CAU 1671 TaxID=3032593 RepID=UPI0023DCD804|nr:LPP20 family lipoprotein [Neptuniibacter sp. CAU 1671]MDF2181760.1 LPP20 family lipoprotein [Neptuniibacter sp. CAU 1671]